MPRRRHPLLLALALVLVLGTPVFPALAQAAPRKVRVFVALCDNRTQGIQKVGERIGNGDDPEQNLYWGCSDGFGSFFGRNPSWKVTGRRSDISPAILRQLTLRSAAGDIELQADAYRGSAMRDCLGDFEQAAASGQYDLVAFLGHNGLMDFTLPPPAPVAGNATEVVVVCCLSESYFADRLRANGCRPVLLTRQLMYPGSFLLAAQLERWRQGASVAEQRLAAARAYAANQKISLRAAESIFAR